MKNLFSTKPYEDESEGYFAELVHVFEFEILRQRR